MELADTLGQNMSDVEQRFIGFIFNYIKQRIET